MRKKWIALLLALMMILPLCAHAESGWTCPSCGQTNNTGNFCPNCASPRPSAEWNCPSCGQTGNTGNFCSNCAAPRDQGTVSAPEVRSAVVDPTLEQIPGEAERGKVIPTDISASSFISNKNDPNRWSPANAADGNETTCWQFSAKKGLKGKSWLQLDYAFGAAVDEIWFKNGFWAVNDKGKDQYVINARLKAVKVEFLYAGEKKFRDPVEFTLADESRNGWQQFSVGHHENVSQVRIGVVSVYKGSSFPNDVCLSEVMMVRYAPAETAMIPQGGQTAVVYESRPDITGVGLLDKIATRSGPGTNYEETHTFFPDTWQTETVLVLKKSNAGGVWWVQLDFRNGTKGHYRVWTGAKRVDVDLSKVAEDKWSYECDISPTNDVRLGPGGDYAKSGMPITRYAVGNIYAQENGYVDVDYWYEDDGYDGNHRVWIPADCVFNLWNGDHSGET